MKSNRSGRRIGLIEGDHGTIERWVSQDALVRRVTEVPSGPMMQSRHAMHMLCAQLPLDLRRLPA